MPNNQPALPSLEHNHSEQSPAENLRSILNSYNRLSFFYSQGNAQSQQDMHILFISYIQRKGGFEPELLQSIDVASWIEDVNPPKAHSQIADFRVAYTNHINKLTFGGIWDSMINEKPLDFRRIKQEVLSQNEVPDEYIGEINNYDPSSELADYQKYGKQLLELRVLDTIVERDVKYYRTGRPEKAGKSERKLQMDETVLPPRDSGQVSFERNKHPFFNDLFFGLEQYLLKLRVNRPESVIDGPMDDKLAAQVKGHIKSLFTNIEDLRGLQKFRKEI
jgi:hypothetical protein